MIDPASLAELGPTVVVVALFLFFMWKAGGQLIKALNKLTASNDRIARGQEQVAEAIEDGNKKSETRNGHLGEQNVQITNLITKSHQEIAKTLKTIQKQQVNEQTVKHQTVEHTD